jgi:hypothetical protein
MKKYTFNATALRLGFRSGLEAQAAQELKVAKVTYEYEAKDKKLAYTKPSSKHKYNPDFSFPDSNIIIETKGIFSSADRAKMLLVRDQHPEVSIRFVFSNMNARIGKKSKTTYALWCERNGFQYANKHIPSAWIEEIKDGSKSD